MEEIEYKFKLIDNIERSVRISIDELISFKQTDLSYFTTIINTFQFIRKTVIGTIAFLITLFVTLYSVTHDTCFLVITLILIVIGLIFYLVITIIEKRFQNYHDELEQVFNVILANHHSVLGFSMNMYETLHLLSIYQLHIVHQLFFLVIVLKEELFIQYMKFSEVSKYKLIPKSKKLKYNEKAIFLDTLMSSVFKSKMSSIKEHLESDPILISFWKTINPQFSPFLNRKSNKIQLHY